MDVDGRADVFDRAADREIGRSVVIGMNSALQADFDRAAIPGLDRPALDFLQAEIVRPSAQVCAELSFRERTELAAVVADVRIVDVARDHIAHGIAGNLLS